LLKLGFEVAQSSVAKYMMRRPDERSSAGACGAKGGCALRGTKQGAIPAPILRALLLFNDIATVTADDIRDTPADLNPVAER
jgi:hypothetical protein